MKETLTETDHGVLWKILLISTSYLISLLKVPTYFYVFPEILIVSVLSINELISKLSGTVTVTLNVERHRFRSVKIIDDR